MMRYRIFILLVLFLAIFFNSCYKDNLAMLNPGVKEPCDTSNVTYANKIMDIMTTKCISCHSSGNAQGGLQLDSYAKVKASALTGKLYNSVAWNGKANQMPQGNSQISDCSINQIKIWIAKNYSE